MIDNYRRDQPRPGVSRTKGRKLLFNLIIMSSIMLFGIGVSARTSYSEREVTFNSDTTLLSGTLMIPTSGELHPAVIFLHGSGPVTREGARSYAEEFASMGIASLFFDKRGTGKSGGSWITASLDDLANDALAAVNFVKNQAGIDSSRIGLWGVSQAGWVEAHAAAKSGDIAFLIIISGGGASPHESELFSYKNAFDEVGFSASDDSAALQVLDLYFQYLGSGKGLAQLASVVDSIRSGTLKPLAEELDKITPSEANQPNWSWVATYDPSPDIAKISCPVLLMFGDRDMEFPTDTAVPRWRSGLKAAGNNDATIMIFKGAGHGIRMKEGYSGRGRAPFADGYLESQLGWLWQHVVQGKQ